MAVKMEGGRNPVLHVFGFYTKTKVWQKAVISYKVLEIKNKKHTKWSISLFAEKDGFSPFLPVPRYA